MNAGLPLWVQVVAAFGPIIITAVLAWITWRYTRHTGRMVEEMRAAREAQERAAAEVLDRLLNRVRSNLTRMQALSERLRDHPPEAPFPADVGDELEVLWVTYYRLSGPIFSLGDDDLSERIDDFFQRVRRAGFLIRDIEEKSMPGDPNLLLARLEAMRVERGEQEEVVLGLGTEAADLLGELVGLDPTALARRPRGGVEARP